MNTNLLKKLCISTALTLALAGCSEDDGTAVLIPGDVAAPVATELNITATWEESEVVEMSLVDGVTSPDGTPLFIRDLTYLERIEDEDGQPILDADGNVQLLFQGPPLAFRAVTAVENTLTFDGLTFGNRLLHPSIVAIREQERQEWFAANPNEDPANAPAEFYSQGVYRFTYRVDNGASEQIERELTVTVNAVEDLVESIRLSASMLDVPLGTLIQINAGVFPVNATFRGVTWTSSDENVATVDETGTITAVDSAVGSSATITATSESGDIATSLTANVIDAATQPVLLNITSVGRNVSALEGFVGFGESAQLSAQLIPEDGMFTNDVSWLSSDPDSVFVDDTGRVSGLTNGGAAEITATVVDIPDLTQTITVNIINPRNLLAAVNGTFETGQILPWTHHWQSAAIATIEVGEDYGVPHPVFGNNGVRVTSDGSANTGILLSPDDSLEITSLIGQNPTSFYFLSVDVKYNGVDAADTTRSVLWRNIPNGPGSWPLRYDGWMDATNVWQTFTFIIEGRDWSPFLNGDVNGPRIEFWAQANGNAVDIQFDNLIMIEIPNPNE